MESRKTFTAQEFTKQPHIVYRTADREGEVIIKHRSYRDREFVLSCNHVEEREEEWAKKKS